MKHSEYTHQIRIFRVHDDVVGPNNKLTRAIHPASTEGFGVFRKFLDLLNDLVEQTERGAWVVFGDVVDDGV